MSVTFIPTAIEFRREAKIQQRTDYYAKYDALHLESNSARKLPFSIRVPAGFELDQLPNTPCLATFARHEGKMTAWGDGQPFTHYKLQIRTVDGAINNPHLRRGKIVIERVFHDALPLTENPAGYKMPDTPGLPTADDPIIVASHTADGRGWYTYKIYTE